MANKKKPTINLALQGGGAHGAFTWGVLDGLLEAGIDRFDGVSGTSAGAMNALCLGHGLMEGGPEGARQALSGFWRAIADSSPFSGAHNPAVSPALKMMMQWTQYLTPEQLNPFDLNPLRDILETQFNFTKLKRNCPVKLFIAATHANSGKIRVFRNPELSADAFLASACLPTIHRTIVIKGEPYWDGGYSANPAVFPLFHECEAEDVLLVLLTPLRYAETPETAEDIRVRLRELSFNSTFLREMRMFAHLKEQATPSRLPAWLLDRLALARSERRLSRLRFHAITAEKVLGEMPADSKLNVSHQFFDDLFTQGRALSAKWLTKNRDNLGRNATLDLSKLFY